MVCSSNLFRHLLTTTAGAAASMTLPTYSNQRSQQRRGLTAGLWIVQAHAYAMALAGILPDAAANTTRRCLSSMKPAVAVSESSMVLPAIPSSNLELPTPRSSSSLTIHDDTNLPEGDPRNDQILTKFKRTFFNYNASCFFSRIPLK